MSQLTQDAVDSCDGLIQALNGLHGMLLQFCPPDKLPVFRVEFANVRTRAAAIKGLVTAACVCQEAPDPPPQPTRSTRTVPMFPPRLEFSTPS